MIKVRVVKSSFAFQGGPAILQGGTLLMPAKDAEFYILEGVVVPDTPQVISPLPQVVLPDAGLFDQTKLVNAAAVPVYVPKPATEPRVLTNVPKKRGKK